MDTHQTTQQNGSYKNTAATTQASHPQRSRRGTGQKSEKMPKTRVLALASAFKRGLSIASILGFGTFATLAAFHQVRSSAQLTSGSAQTTTTSTPTSQKSSSFLTQQGVNNIGSSQSTPVSATPTPVSVIPTPAAVSRSHVS